MSFLIAPRVLEFILSFVVLRYPSSRISTLASWIRMLDRNLPRKDETSFLLSVAASRFSEIPLLRPFSILRGRHGVPRRLPFDYEYPPRARLFSPTLYQYALVFFFWRIFIANTFFTAFTNFHRSTQAFGRVVMEHQSFAIHLIF
jgi:hypothetical protein